MNVEIYQEEQNQPGLEEPYICLIAKTEVGIIVTPAVFKTRNVTIESVATPSFSLLKLFILFIAFKPLGVAAKPRPNYWRQYLQKYNLKFVIL